MRSARKRRQEGLDVLQQVNGAHTHTNTCSYSWHNGMTGVFVFPLVLCWDLSSDEISKSGVAGMQVLEHLSHTVQTMAVFRSHLMSAENRLLLGSTPLCRVRG